MTISANAATELQRDDLFRGAMMLAGVWDSKNPLLADDIAAMTNFLRVELQEMQARGLFQQHAARTTLPITAGTVAYPLPVTILDVCTDPGDRFAGTFQATGSKVENRVQAMTAREYMAISNKVALSSWPRRVLIERAATGLSATFYPKPSVSGTWNYRAVSLIRDDDTGTVTLDIPRPLQSYVLHKMAYYAAMMKSAAAGKIETLLTLASDLRRDIGWDLEAPKSTQLRPARMGARR